MAVFNLPILAKQATVKIGATLIGTGAIDVSTSRLITTSSLSALLGVYGAASDTTETVKDVSVSGGGRDVEVINLLGLNQLIEEKRPEVFEIKFTRVAGSDMTGTASSSESGWELGDGLGQTAATSFKRTNLGEKSSNDRLPKTVLLQFDNNAVSLVLLATHVYFSTPEWSLDAEGSVEETLTGKCLAQNVYIEDNQS